MGDQVSEALTRKRVVAFGDYVKQFEAAEAKGADPGDATSDLLAVKTIANAAVKQSDPEQRILEMTISDASVDRDRDIIDPKGWDITNFQANPVVLWAHSYSRLPVGRDTGLKVDSASVVGHPQFTDIDPFADMVYRMLVGKFLNASSVGFQPLEWTRDEERRGYNIVRAELLEYSIVPVPANPNCLVQARSVGIDVSPLKAWAEEALDGMGFAVVSREHLEVAYKIASGDRIISVPKLAMLIDGKVVEAEFEAAKALRIEAVGADWTREFSPADDADKGVRTGGAHAAEDPDQDVAGKTASDGAQQRGADSGADSGAAAGAGPSEIEVLAEQVRRLANEVASLKSSGAPSADDGEGGFTKKEIGDLVAQALAEERKKDADFVGNVILRHTGRIPN